MKLLAYYLSILFPLPLLFLVGKKMDALTFVIFLALYILYKSILDFNKLVEKEIFMKKDFWKSNIPFLKLKYFKELYLQP